MARAGAYDKPSRASTSGHGIEANHLARVTKRGAWRGARESSAASAAADGQGEGGKSRSPDWVDGQLANRADAGWRDREVIGWDGLALPGAVIMHARDPVEAVEVLNALLKFFGDGERWIKGRF